MIDITLHLILQKTVLRRLCTSLLAVGIAATLAAQSPVGESQTGFQLIDDYIFVVDGADSESATIYSSTKSRAILVVSSDLESPMLLWPRTRAVESLQFLKVAKKGYGFIEILPDPVLETHRQFEILGSNVVFYLGDKELRLKPKPALIGLHDLETMFQKSKVYARRADEYSPTEEILQDLKSPEQSGQDMRVRVFFGSWCPACGQMVPRIMKVANELQDSGLAVEFYGLPRGFSGEPEATRYEVKSVPTGIIFIDGKEVGRLTGNDWRSPESALRNFKNAG